MWKHSMSLGINYSSPITRNGTSMYKISMRSMSKELLPNKKRVSRRAIIKKEEDLARRLKQKTSRESDQEKKRDRTPIFSKSPKDLWVKPNEPKYKEVTVPDYQKNNFRYRQSPSMRIRDLALSGKAKEALEIFNTEILKSNKDRIDEFTYNQLLLACSRSGKWNMGFKVYNDMKKRAVTPTVVTITNLLNCLAEVTYPTLDEKVKYTREKVNYVINEMEKHSIQPNTQSYNVMLKVLGSIGDATSALRLVNEMNANPKVEVDITTYTSLISTLGKDNLAAVFSVWDDLKERDIKPSIHFYHTIMKYCNIHRKAELAIEVSLQMLEENVQWDHRTLSLLCTSYGILGQATYSGVLLKKIDELSIQMDSILWNSLLRLGTMKAWHLTHTKWMSDIHSAEQFINEMEKRLFAIKAAPSTVEKTINMLKTEELEALLLGSLNCVLLDHFQKYFQVLLKRNPEYKLTDHYQSKYNRLISKSSNDKVEKE